MLQDKVWIAVEFARAMGCREREIVEVFEAALSLGSAEMNVTAWAARMGLPSPRPLNLLLERKRLPGPAKALFDGFRVVRLVASAEASANGMTREALARQFGYCSADYLGKRLKELTGLTFMELVSAGVDEVIETVSRRLKGTASP
jgi:AraC-like DNA-binding protein